MSSLANHQSKNLLMTVAAAVQRMFADNYSVIRM